MKNKYTLVDDEPVLFDGNDKAWEKEQAKESNLIARDKVGDVTIDTRFICIVEDNVEEVEGVPAFLFLTTCSCKHAEHARHNEKGRTTTKEGALQMHQWMINRVGGIQ